MRADSVLRHQLQLFQLDDLEQTHISRLKNRAMQFIFLVQSILIIDIRRPFIAYGIGQLQCQAGSTQ